MSYGYTSFGGSKARLAAKSSADFMQGAIPYGVEVSMYRFAPAGDARLDLQIELLCCPKNQ